MFNERNTRTVCVTGAIAAVLLMICAVVGNTLAAQATEREVKHDSDNLVRCVEAGKSATECRTLIYGAR